MQRAAMNRRVNDPHLTAKPPDRSLPMIFPDLSRRILESESMDDPALDAAEHERALRGLRRIRFISGAARTIWRPIGQFITREKRTSISILDVACGGGDLAITLERIANRANIDARIDGCDISERATRLAASRAARSGSSCRFFELDGLHDELPTDYDIIISSLFLHHLTDDDIVQFIRRAGDAARRMIIMSDLQRTRLGYLLAFLGTRTLSRSPVVHRDSLLSVRAALTTEELRGLAESAGLTGSRILRCWPERMMLIRTRP
jgi:2-polyprenyl-3-methyl-5-hydroxy-6-metoxy-1,4-benzoquinol methylase